MNADRINEHYFGELSDATVQRCRERIHWICKQARGKKVLDIGCSQGIVSLILGREGFECTGIDIEQASLAFARKGLKKEDEIVRNRVKFRLADASALPFKDNFFDSVILGEVLEHLTHPEKVLSEAHRVLKDGGAVIITVPYGLHPYHDHKQTYYPVSFLKLLQPYFGTDTVEVRNNYILYCGVKRAACDAVESVEEIAFALSRWEAELENRCLEKELALFETSTRLYAEIKSLNEQVKTLRQRIQEGNEKADQANEEWQRRLSVKERELSNNAAAKERELKEWNAKLRSLEQELASRIDSAQAENEKTLHLLEQDFNSKLEAKEREISELRSRHAAAQQLHEKELHESASKQLAEFRRSLQTQRIKEVVRTSVPAGANVLVISKGDDNLLSLEGRYGSHFPQTEGGVYAGFHPANSTDAIAHLEDLRARGAGFFLIPSAAFWWLDHYSELRQHLESNYRLVTFNEDTCLIYALRADVERRSWVRIVENKLEPSAETKRLPANGRVTSGRVEKVGQTKKRTDKQRPLTAAVLDEFTTACFQPECELITFRPDNWKQVLREHEPDMLLVESAWRGNDGSWQYKIASYEKPMGDELAQLVKDCKSRGIPTVFWNKEDPSNFNRFIDKAGLFDYVFTSDSDCIPKYKKRLKHNRIFPLAFAAQPKIHNPLASEKRDQNVCFAGAYYGIDHDERRLDMDLILKPALDYGLHIYDRQHGLAGYLAEQFRFPDIYQPAIKGRLEYEGMLRAYKKYKVFLNVNSVKTSPTMFSRRVFELLACGTPVISAYAKGIEKMLGRDVVLITKSEEETRKHLESLLRDEKVWAQMSARGIRAVLESHTYTNRLNQILTQVGLQSRDAGQLKVTVIAKLSSRAEVVRLIETLKRQTYPVFDVLVRLEGGLKKSGAEPLRNALKDIDVEVISNRSGSWVERIKGDYLWVVNSEDYYGPNFLKDCALATTYCQADVIGKHTHFRLPEGSSEFNLSCPGREFQTVKSLPFGSFILKTRTTTTRELETLLANRVPRFSAKQMLSIDRFNYISGTYGSERIGPQRMKRLAGEISI
jgi:SAM-dependent methyltransferase/glycosyltransferase involved in cell wall biosynthesis